MSRAITGPWTIAEQVQEVARALEAGIGVSIAVERLFDIADSVRNSTPASEVTRHTQQSSVSIDRLSSGKHTISIKVYDDDPDAALNKAIELLEKAEADVAAQAGGES